MDKNKAEEMAEFFGLKTKETQQLNEVLKTFELARVNNDIGIYLSGKELRRQRRAMERKSKK